MPQVTVQNARFTLILFGTFRLLDGEQDIAIRGRKACALLAFLALVPGHRATREHIADLLWTDRGPEQARASLRQTIAELRAISGFDAALDIQRAEIALRDDVIASDLSRVLEAAVRGDLAALAQALAPIAGELLVSFGDVAPRFDEWLGVERPAQLDRLVSQSLACVERAGMTRGEDVQAILRSLDRLEPLNEGVARLGMRLDHAAGDSAALHRRYRRLVDQLADEFGASPAEATRSLFQQLTRAQPSSTETEPAPRAATMTAVADELTPAVIVAPLQLVGDTGLSSTQAEFCSDDMRVAISAMNSIRVLAADSVDIPALVAGCADSLALYLLSGKVRDPGGGAVATLQLADARRHTIVWSASICLNGTTDPLEAIVAKAVGALQPAIDRDLDALMRTAPDDLGDERAMFTRARLTIRNAANLAETRRGVEALERIVARNPRHLGARLLLGRMYNTDFWQQVTGHDVAAMRARAAEHLEAAAGLAPDRLDVRVRRAWVLLRQGACDSAARDFDAVLAERQFDADILNQCAFGLCHLGELDRAADVMQQAFDLNPFAPSDYHADYAVIQALRDKAAEAEDHFLVSGETGLQYDAVRIANSAGLPSAACVIDAVESRFARKFIAAWQGARPPKASDVLAWMGHTLPLREPGHREFVHQGLERRLARFWPAA